MFVVAGSAGAGSTGPETSSLLHCVVGRPSSAAGTVGFAGIGGRLVPNRAGCTICCRDGDPTCDHDGAINGACRFLVDACVDPSPAADGSDTGEEVLAASVARAAGAPGRKTLAQALAAIVPTAAPACAAPTPVTVVRRPGRQGKTTLPVRTARRDAHRLRRERSRLTLLCLPTSCDERWPAAAPVARWMGGTAALGSTRNVSDEAVLAAADARIDRLRRRDLTLRVVDHSGRPVGGAPVEVWQVRRAFPIGTAVTHFQSVEADPRYLGLVSRFFNAVVTENSLKWEETEPAEGVLEYGDAERWLEWARRHQIDVKGTAIMWGASQGRPLWLRWKSPDQVRIAVERRITEMLTRFRGRIRVWDAVNEPIFAPQFDTILGPGYIADVFRWGHAADPDATLVLNEAFPTSSRAALLAAIEEFKTLVRERLFALGVAPDALGFQGHGPPVPLEWIEAAFDSLAELGLPIHVTEFDGFPLRDEETQADYYEGVLRVAFAHPAVTSIMLWGFDDAHHWLGGLVLPLPGDLLGAGLYDAAYRPKPAAGAMSALLGGRWRTHERGVTAADGTFRIVGFLGDYEARIGRTHTRFALDADGPESVTIAVARPAR